MMKAALHNLGCKVNAYETEAMKQDLENNGYEIVPFDEMADVYIINTCTVTNIADRKSRQMLHRAKKMNPEALVVAAGCYVQAAADQLQEDASVDILIGNNRKKDLVSIIGNHLEGRQDDDAIIDINTTQEYEELHIPGDNECTRINIKIQDGCNQFCSYCIIPYARGRVRSRSIQDVVKEVETLAAKGYKEVILNGIHLSSYGTDFEDGTTLIDVIREIARINGIRRIRLGSLEPRIITEDFAQSLCRIPQICPHFHLSLQSGSDEILGRMNRKYSTGEYYEKCGILRKYFDNPGITTDIIAGFPGETEEEFEETRAFLDKVRFSDVHVFKYSRRQGTKAAAMKNQVTASDKTHRSTVLIELAADMSREYKETFQNREVEILLEEEVIVNGKKYLSGYTGEYIRAAVEYGDGLLNEIVSARICGPKSGEILLAEFKNVV
ncbi:tRNA (N(6)-L-threonylcarbamoyladenosine(37)-C(2))-methylthiotransferase MtaB [Parasporobacterium paucivorans]